MQNTKKRHRSQTKGEEYIIILLLSLVIVIPIVLIIVNSSKESLNHKKETTTQKPTIALSIPEETPMQSISEEIHIALDTVLPEETAHEEIVEIKIHTISALSAETETNAVEETENSIQSTIGDEKRINVFSEEESKLIHTIARVIYAEACGEPLLGKVAVGATIVNRLNSEYFPDTIEEVLEGQYARYDWVTDEHLAQIPECVEAAERALMGEDPLAEELGEPTVYFLNPETSVQREVEYRKAKKNATIGHHMFSGLSLYW